MQAADPGRFFVDDVCWNLGNGCAGDIRLNNWATNGYGLVRPVLLLPEGQCNDDLRAILAHELAHARGHDLAWNFAVPVGGLVFMRLALDGAPLAGSQAFIMGTSFMTGAYQATASGGAHVISLQYQTDSAFSYDPSVPWESAVLQALVFDQ